MRNAIDNRQFTKIFIEGDEDAIFVMRVCQNFIIAGIFLPVASPNHVIPG